MVDKGSLEIFRHSLISIVEEMGVTLQRTAYSTNIKIRRDHTCALFDKKLRHIAQHDIAPQHIGSLVSVVPRIMNERPDLEPGDGILVNDPYMGAVHLPDIMLISPLFLGNELLGYAANSAHHVDIGGPTPGGIPNDSTELYGEGLIISGVKAVRNWAYDDEVLSIILRNVRGKDMRKGDFHAQLGANKIGEDRYIELHKQKSGDILIEYLDELIDYTERRVREAIKSLPDGTYTASDKMDGDGISDEQVILSLSITIDNDDLMIDFTGTGKENEGPLNCTPAMAFAGTMSVIMSFLSEDIPKNEGFYRAIDVITPEGTMVNPSKDRPVAAGWEIAVRAGDLVTKAMSEAVPQRTIAGTKGIVANVAYGGHDPRCDQPYVYYETVAGGYGARAERDGMDAVQAHFQNTANSPIEELETELPVYVRRYELIEDSAGAGRQRGGLGVRRDIEFYGERATFSLLTDRASSAPWGLFGGNPGKKASYLINPETDPVVVGSKSTTKLTPGEVGSIQTPGGGGYGHPLEREPSAVLEDIRNGKVSVEAASVDYGVIVDESVDSVDEVATANRREHLRNSTPSSKTDISNEGGSDA